MRIIALLTIFYLAVSVTACKGGVEEKYDKVTARESEKPFDFKAYDTVVEEEIRTRAMDPRQYFSTYPNRHQCIHGEIDRILALGAPQVLVLLTRLDDPYIYGIVIELPVDSVQRVQTIAYLNRRGGLSGGCHPGQFPDVPKDVPEQGQKYAVIGYLYDAMF
jgi:hypothetical protein